MSKITEPNVKSEKAIRSVGRSLSNLNKQIDIIRNQYPEANYFMACSTFNLLLADQTECAEDLDLREEARATSDIINHADCGDW